MQFDVSNVKDAAQRQEAAALFQAMREAEDKLDNADLTPEEQSAEELHSEQRRIVDDAHSKRVDEIYDKYEPQIEAIKAERAKELAVANEAVAEKRKALDDELNKGPYGDLQRAFDTAQKTYYDHPTPALMTEDDDGATLVRCALSGLPLFEGDEVLEDSEGRRVLRCLVLPHLDVAEQEEAA